MILISLRIENLQSFTYHKYFFRPSSQYVDVQTERQDDLSSQFDLSLFSTEFSPTSKPLKCRSPLLLNLQQKAGSLGDFKVKETSYNTSQSKALIRGAPF